MAALTISRCLFFIALFIQTTANVCCYQYKVGDLDAWNIPYSANPNVYGKWSKNHHFKLGDSLFFLYPPSQDSVLQVTQQSYNSCNLKDPILYMNDGNSLFNITSPGDYFFVSGAKGHCEKSQKIRISLPGNGSYAFSPSDAPTAASPSYPTVFGAIPVQASSSPFNRINPIFTAAVIVFLMFVMGQMQHLTQVC